jgi:hypothetical protein
MTNEEIKEVDFELPEIEPSSSLRIHSAPGESACVSCEG